MKFLRRKIEHMIKMILYGLYRLVWGWGGGIRQETRDFKENVEGKVEHVEKWEIHIFS